MSAQNADPRTGAISVSVDGKDWTLLMDFNAMCDFKEATGLDALAFLDTFGGEEEPDMLIVRRLIHCALIQTHPDVDLKIAGRILTVAPTAMMSAAQAALPEPEADDEDIPKEPEPGEETAAQE